jgi:hypothetical protein
MLEAISALEKRVIWPPFGGACACGKIRVRSLAEVGVSLAQVSP